MADRKCIMGLVLLATLASIETASTGFLPSMSSMPLSGGATKGSYSESQNVEGIYNERNTQASSGYGQTVQSYDRTTDIYDNGDRSRNSDINRSGLQSTRTLENDRYDDNANVKSNSDNKPEINRDVKGKERKANKEPERLKEDSFGDTDVRDNRGKNVENKNTTKGGKDKSDEPAAAMVGGAMSAGSQVLKSITDNVAAIKKPIVSTVTTVGSSQCENVKKLLGVSYRQLDRDDKEPDLNQLKIHVKTDSGVKIYDIGKAARFIPRDVASERKRLDKMVIFIHGFTDDPSKASFQNISESFLSHGEYTVAALDGSPLIRWLYLRATSYVRFMGEKLGETLAAMVRMANQDPKKIIIVGHSLGAHISGFAGKTFLNLTGMTLGRISGLDPAGPCFSELDDELRLHKEDADFVDVMHTDAGVYGISEDIGHVDFYPNGGSLQPDCLFETCSHSRAWLYYSESVNYSRAFPAKKCEDWRTFEEDECGDTQITYMGFPTPSDVRGKFYLQTSSEPPYGKGEEGLMFDGSKPTAKKIIDAGSDVVSGVINAADKLFG